MLFKHKIISLFMCKNINKILNDSTNIKCVFDNLIEFVVKPCDCVECIKIYNEMNAMIIIRTFILKYCYINYNIKIKSISDNNIIFNSKDWMYQHYNKINTLNMTLKLII